MSGHGNSNALLDLVAPGTAIRSSVPTWFDASGTSQQTGTSMATAHVSGAFAALRSADPTATVDTIGAALAVTGDPVTDPGNGLTFPRIALVPAAQSLAPSACYDGSDNDGDGDTDFPNDPACTTGASTNEGPDCDDDVDNDGDGFIDWDGGPSGTADPHCSSAADAIEAKLPTPSCGLGPELALILPLLAALGRGVQRRRCSQG